MDINQILDVALPFLTQDWVLAGIAAGVSGLIGYLFGALKDVAAKTENTFDDEVITGIEKELPKFIAGANEKIEQTIKSRSKGAAIIKNAKKK